MMNKKSILFITGTRADYGKMKSIMKILDADPHFEVYIFVGGMHLLEKFGNTYMEVENDNYKHVYVAYGLVQSQDVSLNLSNTIACLDSYVKKIKPDMIVVHGDRIDALAGAIVGAFNNILISHIEGGELSGTIDESIRHAISKFAQIHFVCTIEAKKRLIQLGEEEQHIYVVGSPDIDIMLSNKLPSLENAKERYDVSFEEYGILMYHPVTTEYEFASEHAKSIVDAVLDSKKNYIVIYPNNDLGSELILNEYKRFLGNSHIRMFPSLRFEYFLTFLKNALFMIGNSSAGIRETGVYGIPAIDIGTRQNGRYTTSRLKNIQHVGENVNEILRAIGAVNEYRHACMEFGKGNSTEELVSVLKSEEFWKINIQKRFIDLDIY